MSDAFAADSFVRTRLGGQRGFSLLVLAAAVGVAFSGPPARAQSVEAAQTGTAAVAAPESASADILEAITVTARKRDESVAKVPESITVFTAQTLTDYNIKSFNDYATKTPNISFSYGSGPTGFSDARAVAIRGITGQNLYGTAGATGFYIDDTPVPGSVDPRVLDIGSIEVLKGPQGTLFGESSLGGNVRLITRKPDLEQSGIGYMVEGGATQNGGSPDYGANLVGNAVITPNALAVRYVFFANHDAGYLTRTWPTDPTSPGTTNPNLNVPRSSKDDQGAQTSWGGSISALLKVTPDFDARLRVMFQSTENNGFGASFAPLPDFKPVYVLDRAFDVQPKANDIWTLPSLDLTWKGNGWTLVSSSSYFHRHTTDLEDSTYGTQQIETSYYQVAGLPAQPYLWDGEHLHNQFTEELRASWEPWNGLSGTVGAFYSHTNTRFFIPPTFANGLVAATVGNTVVGPWPNDMIWTQNNPAMQEDTSIFSEVYYKLAERWSLTLGLRRYWLNQDADFTADGFMNFGPTPSAPQHNSQSGIDPKFSVSYQATDETMVYGTASKGFRAGGAQPFLAFCAEPNLPIDAITHLKSDTLWTYEAGAKVQTQGSFISAAAFHINWQNPQQQVALPCGAYFEINGGYAQINGAEIEYSGHLTRSLQIRAGGGYEKTQVTTPGPLSIVGVNPDSRVAGTPAWNLSVGGVYNWPISATLDGFTSIDYSYTGNSISILNGGGGAQATRPAYSILNLRVGANFGESEVSLNIKNATNAKPNLGDIGYVGYAQYNAAGTVIPMVATMQPRTIMLQYRKSI
jgi:iron complex outermembrane recepter protein